jgi:Kef-type K+ transport system membrane component KefB
MSLLVEISIVILVTLACGALARRLGQSRVIGEIAGGILLGPSALGRLAPGIAGSLFPTSSMTLLDTLSTVGLILFLFLIGAEVDLKHLSEQRKVVSLSSLMSILIPFALAAVLAPALLSRFAPTGTSSVPFVLFLGIAMSITAFPVLARILEERGLQSSRLGTTAMLCAAVGDVIAWMLLAAAVAMVGGNGSALSVPAQLIILAFYIITMIGVVRPAAAWLLRHRKSKEISVELLGLMVVFAFASAAVTNALGFHPLFGAFLAGVCLPRNLSLQQALRGRLDMLVSVLLLPMFFALTGMRTRLDLLNTPAAWLWAAIILIAATIGKVGGASLAARWTGQSWRESLALGVLLNTRGLVELIVLNIGYSMGVFSSTLFTMLVIMALITTACTTPMLNLLGVQNAGRLDHG